MKATNKQTKEFVTIMESKVAEKKTELLNLTAMHIQQFEELLLIPFTNEQPYTGELKNKVFFTYCDHYHANSGTWMDVGKLTHPHVDIEVTIYLLQQTGEGSLNEVA